MPKRSYAWSARLSLAALVVTGLACQAGRTCHGPSRAVTPARPVRAPNVGLLGIKLDADAKQLRDQCSQIGTMAPTGGGQVARCQVGPPAKYDPKQWGVGGITIRFDSFGRAKVITAEGGLEIESEQQVVRSILSDISTAVGGDPNEGGLYWCATQGKCGSTGDHALWRFEGGEVWLRSRRSGNTLELELSHTHPDLEERVIYGLPVCG
jgi:hypothetical protein